ncbi:MAG: hypothetical protein GF308_12170 [Candidatus Heimdallarchaeota archaeon]|nr:hypothetical protein [Candidatus Heimdallarchaeota archaeon]
MLSLVRNKKSRNYLFLISVLILFFLVFAQCSSNIRCYHSWVYPDEYAYFKVLDLELNVSYNFTLATDEYWQSDYGFSIHLNEKPKDKNVLTVVDTPGIRGETTLFIPDESADYYIRVFENYGSGFFDITVHEHVNGTEKIVEPYDPPIFNLGWSLSFNWRWVWIPAAVIGGLIVLSIVIGLFVEGMKRINWQAIRFPRIRFPRIRFPRIRWPRIRLPRIRWSRIHWPKINWNLRRKNPPDNNKVLKEESAKQLSRKDDPASSPFVLAEDESITILTPSSTIRCMVSSLVIDFEEDEIVACPYCGNFAKKNLLAEWLKMKGICPICRKKLPLDLCPRVIANQDEE